MKMDAMQEARNAWASLPIEIKSKAGGCAAIYPGMGELHCFAFVGSDGFGWSCPVVPGRVWVVMRAAASGVSFFVELHNEAGAMMSGLMSGGWFECTTQGLSWSAQDRENWTRAWAVLGFDVPFPVPVKL
jgi:hypothetical protein